MFKRTVFYIIYELRILTMTVIAIGFPSLSTQSSHGLIWLFGITKFVISYVS